LYLAKERLGDRGAALCALIERSLGAPRHYSALDDRAAFMQVAREEGVRIPTTLTIANAAERNVSLAQIPFPAVLKANGTSGGTGVRVVQNLEEAAQAVKLLEAPPLLARAAKRAIFDRDRTLLLPAVQRTRSKVTAQSFVRGREATSAHACWKGTVLASLYFEVLQKSHASGHATVLRRIEHPEMAASAERMVRRLELSGLHGFDFMLEADSRAAYLIEINPRATQVGHLSFGAGHDLPSALVSAATNLSVSPAKRITENDTIALFPQEWLRDPRSPFLRSGYHDVPWEEPALLRACVRKRGSAAMPRWLERRLR
jgi:biotin carboxylase